jgi:formylglycine-generating enzyme required for sulfatase activity
MRNTIFAGLFAVACAYGAHAQSCPGDVNQDGGVDGVDLGELLADWGPCIGAPPACASDLNGDGFVNADDLGLILGYWGCPVVVPAWASLIQALPDPAVVPDPDWRAAIISTGFAWRVRDSATEIEMLLVPPGTFQMGCTPSQSVCETDENPVHTVTLTHAFYLGRYEVTQGQWAARMGSNPSAFQGQADSTARPVEQISGGSAIGFCAAIGARLPTEAEWEYACRAGTTTAFNNGSNDNNTVASVSWFLQNSGGQTSPVGRLQPNRLGFYDMHGNVYEWVSDLYSETYYQNSPATNPAGPSAGDAGSLPRCRRGGSWNVGATFQRSSNRANIGYPWGGSADTGIRVARTP